MSDYNPYRNFDPELEALYEPAPVDPALVPPLHTLPPVFRKLIRNPRDVLTATNLPGLTEEHFRLFPNLHLCPPGPLPDIPLPGKLPPSIYGDADLDIDEPGEIQALVENTVLRVSSYEERQDRWNTVALHLGHQRLHLDYTLSPLLVCLVENRRIDIRITEPVGDDHATPQTPLVVMYLIAMAQKWFTGVPEDNSVRVWAVATKINNAVQIFWADIQREGLRDLNVKVQRSEVFREISRNKEQKEWLKYYVAGICREVFERAKPAENQARWQDAMPLPISLEEAKEQYGEGYVMGLIEMTGGRLLENGVPAEQEDTINEPQEETMGRKQEPTVQVFAKETKGNSGTAKKAKSQTASESGTVTK